MLSAFKKRLKWDFTLFAKHLSYNFSVFTISGHPKNEIVPYKMGRREFVFLKDIPLECSQLFVFSWFLSTHLYFSVFFYFLVFFFSFATCFRYACWSWYSITKKFVASRRKVLWNRVNVCSDDIIEKPCIVSWHL